MKILNNALIVKCSKCKNIFECISRRMFMHPKEYNSTKLTDMLPDKDCPLQDVEVIKDFWVDNQLRIERYEDNDIDYVIIVKKPTQANGGEHGEIKRVKKTIP